MGTKQLRPRNRLWLDLRKADTEAARRFPCSYDRGLGRLGLNLLSHLKHYSSVSTPENTLTFAHTGGEGVHFSFLLSEGRVKEDSPIVCTVPTASGSKGANHIVGENLFDFLCLGYHRGYFALEQLGHKLDKTLAAFASKNWKPESNDDSWVGYCVDDHQRKLLDFLIERFQLSPWKNLKSKFGRLQKQYLPLLTIPQDPLDWWRTAT